ncbi:uncharacterized protein LOC113374965 [Ctenocephalides felis]|uniref:uncharacterized protein LOC113374965 n=1 Tax=Ctenocephalides felis TaxID=7515 RepID=UPI000E6E1B3B|nr:uncharacterized protein LOC113374965 [Ctenocephalides felis]
MEWNKTKTQFLRLDSLLKGNELLIVEKQTAIKIAKDKLHEAEQQLKEISETYLTLQSSTKKLDNDLLKLKNNRHKVFMDCKVQTAKKLCICCTIRNSKMMSSANDE